MALVAANSFSGRIDQSVWIGALDVVKPVIASTTVDAYGNNMLMNELIYHKLQTNKKVVNNSLGWSWYDDMRFNQKMIVVANASTATTDLGFTVGPVAVNTLGGQRSVYFAVGDYLMDMDTGQGGRITSVVDGGTNWTIRAKSIDDTNWVAPTAGKEYGIYTYAELEDSLTLPDAKDSYVEQKSAKLQRFAVKYKATADVLTDELWINTTESGEYFGTWGDRGIMNAEKRMAAQQVGAMWLGAYTSATGLPMTTRGIWHAFIAEATSVDYTAGAMTIAQVRNVITAMKNNGVAGGQTWTLPYITNTAVQAVLQSQGALTNLNVQTLFKNQKTFIFEDTAGSSQEGMKRLFDVNEGVLDGVPINFRLLNISYDPNIFGVDAANNTFIRSGFCTPTARTKDGQGNASSLVEMGYKSLAGLDLMSTYGSLGFLAKGGANSEENARITGMRSFMGFGLKGLTQCVLLEEA